MSCIQWVYILVAPPGYMFGKSEPFNEILEDVLEKVQKMLYDVVVELTEEGYLGR